MPAYPPPVPAHPTSQTVHDTTPRQQINPSRRTHSRHTTPPPPEPMTRRVPTHPPADKKVPLRVDMGGSGQPVSRPRSPCPDGALPVDSVRPMVVHRRRSPGLKRPSRDGSVGRLASRDPGHVSVAHRALRGADRSTAIAWPHESRLSSGRAWGTGGPQRGFSPRGVDFGG